MDKIIIFCDNLAKLLQLNRNNLLNKEVTMLDRRESITWSHSIRPEQNRSLTFSPDIFHGFALILIFVDFCLFFNLCFELFQSWLLYFTATLIILIFLGFLQQIFSKNDAKYMHYLISALCFVIGMMFFEIY
jgi:small-conductance mechanosensitive channel